MTPRGEAGRDQNGAGGDAQRNVPPRPRGRRYPLEDGDIGAFRDVDADVVVEALGLVIFLQTRAKAAGLDAHDRVGAGIVAGRSVEDLQRQSIFFEILRAAGQRLFHAEAQEPLETPRLRKARTGQNLFEVNANGVAGNRRCRAGHAFHSSGMVFAKLRAARSKTTATFGAVTLSGSLELRTRSYSSPT